MISTVSFHEVKLSPVLSSQRGIRTRDLGIESALLWRLELIPHRREIHCRTRTLFAFLPPSKFLMLLSRYQRLAPDANTWGTNNNYPPPPPPPPPPSLSAYGVGISAFHCLFELLLFLSSSFFPTSFFHLVGLARTSPCRDHSAFGPTVWSAARFAFPSLNPAISSVNRNRDRCRSITPQRLPQR
jgi:hypothetical protein